MGHDLFEIAAAESAPFVAPTLPDLPPFQGGLAGVLSYDLAHEIEDLPIPAFDEFALPTATLGCYDVVLAWDHLARRAWLISQGFPELKTAARRRRAEARAEEFYGLLAASPPIDSVLQQSDGPTIPASFATALPGVTSNFPREGYLDAVRRAIECIRAGDVFQVNLAQCLTATTHEPAWRTYEKLRQRNPATFGGYFDAGDWQIASALPERFVRGARSRGGDAADQRDATPRRRPRGRSVRRRRPVGQREGSRREHHDRRLAAQRSLARL
ncbi:MAG: chorismate-binding protein [Pirellulales bacterium]